MSDRRDSGVSGDGFLPYGRQAIDADDIAAVTAVLRGDWLTQGPAVSAFETALCALTGAGHAVACANGTAALHLAWLALDPRPDDAVIVPGITFLATATTFHHAGGRVVFADTDPDTGLITPTTAAAAIARAEAAGLQVRAIAPVHLAGQTADLPALAELAAAHGAVLVEDACHAIGSVDIRNGARQAVGGCRHSAMTAFSFHPVKTIAAGEGGAVTTDDPELARRLTLLRNHGMEKDPARLLDHDAAFDGDAVNPWYYELQTPGHNYRLSDIHAALALSQLARLPGFVARRAALRARYAERLAPLAPAIRLTAAVPWCEPAWHLAVALIDFPALGLSRAAVMTRLRDRGIGAQVHYIPLSTQPFWRRHAAAPAPLPGAEAYYRRALTLPLFAAMDDGDVDRVVTALAEFIPA